MDNSLGLQVNGAEDSTSGQQEYNAVGWAQSDAATGWNNPEGDTATNDWGDAAVSTTGGFDSGNNPSAVVSNDWGDLAEPTTGDVSDDIGDTPDKMGDGEGFGSGRGGDKSRGRGKSGKSGDGDSGKKGKAYIPAPVAPRAKLTEDELAERMEKIRLQNEKIKERREYVKADEEAFHTSMAAERARQEANRRLQAQINQNRDQNAKRKLEKIGGREWDAGKQDGEWERSKFERGTSSNHPDIETRQGHRGRGGRSFSPRKERKSSRSKPNSRRTPTPDNSTQGTEDERKPSQDVTTLGTKETNEASS